MVVRHIREFFSKKCITVMIVPHSHTGMRQIKVPIRTVSCCAICIGLLVVSLSFFGYQYVGMWFRTSHFNEMLAENGQQKRELLGIADEINQLNTQMESLMVFSRRLQTLIGIENTSELQNRTGGMEVSEIDQFSQLYKKNQKVLLGQIQADIEQLRNDIPYQRSIHSSLGELFQKDTTILASIPSISPVDGGWISSGFGMRADPFTGRRKMHEGIDIAQNRNAPVYATADGTVTYCKRFGSLGNLVSIDHGFGCSTNYAHLAAISVKFNQVVKRGDVIGKVGSTGRSKGVHLHYEVRLDGVAVDPRFFILDRDDN